MKNKGRDLPSTFGAGLAGPPPGEISFQAMEITQAVQDLAHSVPLISDKPTVVRVYFDRSQGGAITIRGEMRIEESNGASQTIPSFGSVVIDPAGNGDLRAKRENLQASLNFLLPATAMAAGRRRFTITNIFDAGTGVSVPFVNSVPTSVTFSRMPPLRARLVLIRYTTGNPPVTHLPTALDRALVRSWLKRAYPVAQVIMSEVTVPSNKTWPFLCGDVNAQISAIRNLDISTGGVDSRTHYYGLVSDGNGANFMRGCAAIPMNPDPSAVGSGPTGSSTWGWDNDGSYGDWYTGHELGHTFGRLHPGSGCGESNDDPNFPYPNGQISDMQGTFVGFDSGDPANGLPMAVLPGTLWHDVMTYCENQWLSYYTYNEIYQRILAEEAVGGAILPSDGGLETTASANEEPEINMDEGDFINVVGRVNLTQETGSIDYVNPVAKIIAKEVSDTKVVKIREKTSDNQVVKEGSPQIKINTCTDPGEDLTAVFDFVMQYDERVATLELIVNDRVVDTFVAGDLDQSNISFGNFLADGSSLALSWDTDITDSNIKYNVQVSTDEGRSWNMVSINQDTPDLTIDREQYEGVETLQVRVMATNGFKNIEVASETFNLNETINT